jgi:cell division protein ZapA (FtsZ GTPase activity inhibitor)
LKKPAPAVVRDVGGGGITDVDVRTISVHILGHEYKVRSTEDGAFVREVALYVDELMHQISAKMSSATPSQIAVLAALNVAEELFRVRRNGGSGAPGEAQEIEVRLKGVLARLGEVEQPLPSEETAAPRTTR